MLHLSTIVNPEARIKDSYRTTRLTTNSARTPLLSNYQHRRRNKRFLSHNKQNNKQNALDPTIACSADRRIKGLPSGATDDDRDTRFVKTALQAERRLRRLALEPPSSHILSKDICANTLVIPFQMLAESKLQEPEDLATTPSTIQAHRTPSLISILAV